MASLPCYVHIVCEGGLCQCIISGPFVYLEYFIVAIRCDRYNTLTQHGAKSTAQNKPRQRHTTKISTEITDEITVM